MSASAPFAKRRVELIDRFISIYSADARFPAGWLEGSLADGSADDYSDIDLHLCVEDGAWDDVWNNRRAVIERVAPIIAALDIMGIFAIACLIEGPMKLDVFFDRLSGLSSRPRLAVKWLWGADDIRDQLKLGGELNEKEIARALEYTVLGFLQGATWPVRILARGQLNTFLYGELLLIETAIVPLMLLQRDPRTFHRNMFVRAKMMNSAEHGTYIDFIEKITTASQRNDRLAMRDVHIEIFNEICRLARAAFTSYQLEFPPRVEAEMAAFYQREWPME